MYVLITYNFYFQNYKDINEMNLFILMLERLSFSYNYLPQVGHIVMQEVHLMLATRIL